MCSKDIHYCNFLQKSCTFAIITMKNILVNALMKTVPINPPNLETGYVAISGIRPYRNGGIRVAKEKIGNKVIIHNYGHGGAGVTLSWGTVQTAIALFDELDHNYREPIAIIGAGIIGLTTALLLLEKGHRVTLYSRATTPHTTSDVSAALWGPYGVETGDSSSEKNLFYTWQYESFNKFKSFVDSPHALLHGVYFLNSYYTKNTNVIPHASTISAIRPPCKIVLLPSKIVLMTAFCLKTYLLKCQYI